MPEFTNEEGPLRRRPSQRGLNPGVVRDAASSQCRHLTRTPDEDSDFSILLPSDDKDMRIAFKGTSLSRVRAGGVPSAILGNTGDISNVNWSAVVLARFNFHAASKGWYLEHPRFLDVSFCLGGAAASDPDGGTATGSMSQDSSERASDVSAGQPVVYSLGSRSLPGADDIFTLIKPIKKAFDGVHIELDDKGVGEWLAKPVRCSVESNGQSFEIDISVSSRYSSEVCDGRG